MNLEGKMQESTTSMPHRSHAQAVIVSAKHIGKNIVAEDMVTRWKRRPPRTPRGVSYLKGARLGLRILELLARKDHDQRGLVDALERHRSSIGKSLKGLLRWDLAEVVDPEVRRRKMYHITTQGSLARAHLLGRSQTCPRCGGSMLVET